MLKISSACLVLCLLLQTASTGFSADLDEAGSEPPAPPVVQSGIWGAIAFSPVDGKHGFFWGADKRDEAEETAIKHCRDAGGKVCDLVTVFRNHRHWTDDDGSGFPYNHCAALAVTNASGNGGTHWAAAAAGSRKEAEDQALSQCRIRAEQCKVRESVCT